MNLKSLFESTAKVALEWGKQHAPSLLTATGIGLGGYTIIKVAQKAPEAKEKKEAAIAKAAQNHLSKVATVWEVTKAVTPVYTEPIITGTLAVGCIVGSDIMVNNRLTKTTKDLASATAGYLAVKKQLENYKETTKEVLGETKAADLKRKAAEREMKESEAVEEKAKDLKYTNEGDKMLVYDRYVDDYYKSSLPDLLKIVTKLSLRVQGCMDGKIPFTDWYDEIGYKLTPEQRSIYEDWGFVVSIHSPEDSLGFDYTATLSPNDVPCLGIEFNNLIPLWKTREKQWS